MNCHLFFSSLFALSLTFSLSTSHAGQAARPIEPLRPKELAQRMDELRNIPWQGKALEKPEKDIGNCRQDRVAIQVGDPKAGTSRTQDIFVIRPPRVEGPVPVMILVPTIKGYGTVERKIASNLCDLEVATIVADVQDDSMKEEVQPWGLEDLRDRYAILALRTVIDYAKLSPYFNPDKVGMIGSSLGGIMTAFVAGLETERLAAVVSVVGGGNLPHILAYSDNKSAVAVREARMRAEKMSTVEEYEEKLRETVRYDPMHFASRVHPEKLLMIISSNDSKVPTPVQWDLHKAFGAPVNKVFSLGHSPTIAALAWVYFDTVSSFLRDRLQLPAFHLPFTPSQVPPEVLAELQCRI